VLEGHTDAVTAVALSADGRRAVSGSHERTLRVCTSLPKPKLPKNVKRKPRFFTVGDVARIIVSAATEQQRCLYWLLAGAGIRSGELSGLLVSNVELDKITALLLAIDMYVFVAMRFRVLWSRCVSLNSRDRYERKVSYVLIASELIETCPKTKNPVVAATM
jgi:integrase